MQYIVATQLRTNTSQLIASLDEGQSFGLLHRSRLVAEIKPIKKNPPVQHKTLAETLDFFEDFLPGNKKISNKDIHSMYRKRLMEEYG